MRTQAACVSVAAFPDEPPPPYSVVFAGSPPHAWGCGLSLHACNPKATLRVTNFREARFTSAASSEAWYGTPFDLFERFCREFFGSGEVSGERHVVVAIAYDAGLPLHGIEPRRLQRGPLLWAAGYETPWVAVSDAPIVVDQPKPLPEESAAATAEKAVKLAAWDASQHERAVRRALDYIAAGDIYQVNLAYPLRATRLGAAWTLFRLMQQLQPVPFGAYVHGGDFELVCNSPENFLSRRGEWLVTRPIKGTRRRGASAKEDLEAMDALRSDPKERAELTMIVDLERNDLGRICEYGSVEVTSHAEVETFASLHHLVSTVRGRLRRGAGWSEILHSMFPGGSVTGAPKCRAMQIIDELEVGARGFYTGALGWLRSPEEADFALLIRTAVVDAVGVEYWTGGGIVADSSPAREYQETLLKARVFLAGWEEAQRR